MPVYVLPIADGPQAAVPLAAPTIEAARNCTLETYKKIKVPAFELEGEMVAYASPDSTYAVTKRFIDAATKSILIGIYDFTAGHIKTLLLDALSRGVKVTLMLDLEGGGESSMFDSLIQRGVDGAIAPACSHPKPAARFFSSCHEKFVVIDDTWVLVQSGNYSKNSIPLNEKDGGDKARFAFGNRDMGLAVRSPALAKFFTKLLRADIALQANAATIQALASPFTQTEAVWMQEAPTVPPKTLFPSKRFKLASPLKVQPVLSPDNYMFTMPALLKSARRSILIEQQYIRGSQVDIAVLLAAMREAMNANPHLDVRIVLGKPFDAVDVKKEQQNAKLLNTKYGLALGDNVRYIDTSRFVHCHNKLVIVDGQSVLISSQNWSDSAVSRNREAGLLLDHKGLATYFSNIFENDWETAFRSVPQVKPTKKATPQSIRAGRFIEVVAADHREV